jgi:hypothetical protein
VQPAVVSISPRITEPQVALSLEEPQKREEWEKAVSELPASDAIVSWVDGQPVVDWAEEIAKRDLAIESYLNDSNPDRAKKYGFRSGQTPRLAWDWCRIRMGEQSESPLWTE